MCNNCLKIKIECCDEYDKRISEYVLNLNCEGCKNYYLFLIDLNIDFKILCLTLIKKNNETNSNKFSRLLKFENLVLKRIDNKMRYILDTIEENSSEMKEGCYLNKMNDLRDFNNFLESIKEANHN